jgi:cell division control protein 6
VRATPPAQEMPHRKRRAADPCEDAAPKRSTGRERREPEVYRPSKATKTTARPASSAHPAALTVQVAPSGAAHVCRTTTVVAPQDSNAGKLEEAAPERLVLPLDAVLARLHGMGGAGIVGREQEQRDIANFLESTVGLKQSGALYVSGRPGCGKTLSVRAAADAYRRRCKVVVLNGMTLVDGARDLFSEILRTVCPAALKEKMDAETCLRQIFTAGGQTRPYLLVLDELDALLQSGCEQSVLAALFSWTQLAGSKLVLIGIANALDLTHRFLPILHSKNCAPQLLTFHPYTEQHLLSILRRRLSSDATKAPTTLDTEVENANPQIKFDLAALDLCARRIAAESGDTRKAMEACREAAKAVVRTGAGSGAKASEPGAVLTVGMAVMAKTLSTLLVNNHKVSDQRLKDLPLHQALLLCTVVLGVRGGRAAHSEPELLSSYQRLCQKHSLPPLPANQLGEMRGALCDIGVLKACAVGKGKKLFSLNVKDEVVQNSFEDLPVYAKILQVAPPCSGCSA